MNQEIIARMPKVELHCHLDGSVSQKMLKRLAKAEGLPIDKLVETIAPKNCQSLEEYLHCFDVVLELLQTEENLKWATYDVIEQAAMENVCYLEIRFAPELHREKGLSLLEVIQAVAAGVTLGEEKFAIKVNLLVCGMRHHDLKINQAVFETASKAKTFSPVVGIDFAGDENNFPPNEFSELLDFASKQELAITFHAGECGCSQNVVESIKLGAKRIGHGVAIKDDLAAMAFCREKNVLLELCPTSNLQTKAIDSLADYPFRKFFDAGIPCCINTDNRGVSQTNLTAEYQLLTDYFQLTLLEMKQLNLTGMQHSFAGQAVKKEMITFIENTYEAENKNSAH